MQKSALRITFPDCFCESALVNCGLLMLVARCDEASRHLISNIKESGFLAHALPQPINVAHGYGLRSGFSRTELNIVRTDRLSNFVNHSYSKVFTPIKIGFAFCVKCIHVFCVELNSLVV